LHSFEQQEHKVKEHSKTVLKYPKTAARVLRSRRHFTSIYVDNNNIDASKFLFQITVK